MDGQSRRGFMLRSAILVTHTYSYTHSVSPTLCSHCHLHSLSAGPSPVPALHWLPLHLHWAYRKTRTGKCAYDQFSLSIQLHSFLSYRVVSLFWVTAWYHCSELPRGITVLSYRVVSLFWVTAWYHCSVGASGHWYSGGQHHQYVLWPYDFKGIVFTYVWLTLVVVVTMMICVQLCTYGETREQALATMAKALDNYCIRGTQLIVCGLMLTLMLWMHVHYLYVQLLEVRVTLKWWCSVIHLQLLVVDNCPCSLTTHVWSYDFIAVLPYTGYKGLFSL